MARSQGVRYPRGGSELWLGSEAGPALLRGEFFGPSTPPAQQITGTAGFEDADAFGAGTVAAGGAGQSITQTAGFADADAFGAGSASQRLTASGFLDGDSFGTGSASQSLQATGFADGDQFGAGALGARIAGAGFADGDAFGVGSISSAPPAQAVVQTAGLDDSDAFGLGSIQLRVAQLAGHSAEAEFGAGAVSVRGGLVRGPRRGSAPRPVQAEARPAELADQRAQAAGTKRTTTKTTRPAHAAATRNAA